jgi:hypothetical protein
MKNQMMYVRVGGVMYVRVGGDVCSSWWCDVCSSWWCDVCLSWWLHHQLETNTTSIPDYWPILYFKTNFNH